MKRCQNLNLIYNPETFIKAYGTDVFRLHILFLGPLDQSITWHNNGLKGMDRFLQRIWSFYKYSAFGRYKNCDTDKSIHIYNKLNLLILHINKNTYHMKFNVNIALLMEFFNYIQTLNKISYIIGCIFIKLLYPYIPHITSEIWETMGNTSNLAYISLKNMLKDWNIHKFISIRINGQNRTLIKIGVHYNLENLILQIVSHNYIKKIFEYHKIKKFIHIQNISLNIFL